MALVVIRLVWPAVTDDTHDSEITENHKCPVILNKQRKE